MLCAGVWGWCGCGCGWCVCACVRAYTSQPFRRIQVKCLCGVKFVNWCCRDKQVLFIQWKHVENNFTCNILFWANYISYRCFITTSQNRRLQYLLLSRWRHPTACQRPARCTGKVYAEVHAASICKHMAVYSQSAKHVVRSCASIVTVQPGCPTWTWQMPHVIEQRFCLWRTTVSSDKNASMAGDAVAWRQRLASFIAEPVAWCQGLASLIRTSRSCTAADDRGPRAWCGAVRLRLKQTFCANVFSNQMMLNGERLSIGEAVVPPNC